MLEPYRVLDFTDERGELGPMLLGDLGTDVIRVEPPGGSDARRTVPFVGDSPAGESLTFQAFNRNKRSIAIDVGSAADGKTLPDLIAAADFLFESAWPSTLAPFGLDEAAIRRINPSIVHVRISPFGSDGPRSQLIANDLVVAAMGGPVSLQGPPDRAPLRVGVPQVWRHTGAEAAAGALVAHARRLKTGEGQFVDVSAQSAMTWTMLQAMDAHAIQGFDFERDGGAMAGISIVHPCRDGYIVALPMSRVILALLDWMIADDAIDPDAREVDWETYDYSLRDPSLKPRYTRNEMVGFLRRFFANHDKRELFEFGIEHGVTLAPVGTLPELLTFEHLQAREYWQALSLPGVGSTQPVKAPGSWARSTGQQDLLSLRRAAPGLDAHGAEIRGELTSGVIAAKATQPGADPSALPFSEVKVADFAWVGVGPISSKYLADHGATVVRVESESRPDVLRGGTPFKDAEPGWNRSQFFGDFNTSKLGLALDMKQPQGIAIAKRLIAWSDVMIESFAPGAIMRMGLDYDHVRELNPGIIMVSTCLMGQTGPARAMAGYGYHAAAIAGFYEVTGWPDQGPCGPWTAYTDTIAPRFVSTVLAAALDRKRRTGEGCYIDLAQLEAALHFLSPEILDHQVNGRNVTRIGNRDRFRAPQSCYPCAGQDAWLAVAVDTDAQWQSLRQVIAGLPECPTNADRLAAHDEVDPVIAAWTEKREVQAAMQELQEAGIPAGVVQRSSDLLADPQYKHRDFYRYLEHGEMGRIPYAGHQYRIAGYDNGPRHAAPMLGEHSFEVLTEVLGFDEGEVSEAYASGAIS